MGPFSKQMDKYYFLDLKSREMKLYMNNLRFSTKKKVPSCMGSFLMVVVNILYEFQMIVFVL